MSSIDFTSFLKLMAHQKASDLFITAGMPPSMKVHGKISPITQNPLTPQQSRDLVLNVMTPQQREEFEKTHECNFAIGVSGVGRFRVSLLLPAQPGRHGAAPHRDQDPDRRGAEPAADHQDAGDDQARHHHLRRRDRHR